MFFSEVLSRIGAETWAAAATVFSLLEAGDVFFAAVFAAEDFTGAGEAAGTALAFSVLFGSALFAVLLDAPVDAVLEAALTGRAAPQTTLHI